jgi:hypothetical protein
MATAVAERAKKAVKEQTNKDTALLLIRGELPNHPLENNEFDLSAACVAVASSLTTLGLISGPLWDEEGPSILAGWHQTGSNRTPIISAVSSERGQPQAKSRKFTERDTIFDVWVTIHDAGRTGIDKLLGDFTAKDIQDIVTAINKQIEGRERSRDAWATVWAMLPDDDTTATIRSALADSRLQVREILTGVVSF